MSEDKYYMSVLASLKKDQINSLKNSIQKTESIKKSEKYNSVMEGYVKSKEYRKEIINIFKKKYHKLLFPYQNMKTQNYKPTVMEKTIIKLTNQSYKLPNVRQKKVDDYEYLDISNQTVAVYQYKTLWTHKIVIAIRGTKDRDDIIPDFYIIRNRHSLSDRFESILNKCDAIHEEYPTAKIYITGHSLGGTLAIWVRQHRNYCYQCYAFSPGYNGFLSHKLKLKYDNLKIFMVKGDIVCNTLIMANSNLLPEPKNLIILSGKDNSPLINHKFKNYMKLIE